MNPVGNPSTQVSSLLQAATARSQTENQIVYAIAGKQQQVMKQAGEAAVQMLEQMVDLQAQLNAGKLDVRA